MCALRTTKQKTKMLAYIVITGTMAISPIQIRGLIELNARSPANEDDVLMVRIK